MKIIREKIKISELQEMQKNMLGNLVKAVVDVEKGIMAVDAPLHADLMEFLIEQENSEPKNLWGINFYPEMQGQDASKAGSTGLPVSEDFIEFDSMINLKPGLGNRTRGIENQEIKDKIRVITKKLIIP